MPHHSFHLVVTIMFTLSVAASSFLLPASGPSRVLKSRAQTLSMLGTEEKTALSAMGYNIAGQLGELKVLNGDEVDAVLSGMRDNLLGEEPAGPLSMYVPMAADLLKSKQGTPGRLCQVTPRPTH